MIVEVGITDLYDSEVNPFKVWLDNHHSIRQPEENKLVEIGEEDIDQLLEDFRYQFQGEFTSLTDYAEHYVEETGLLSGNGRDKGTDSILVRYFDYESFGRDMQLGGDVWTHENGYRSIYVYLN